MAKAKILHETKTQRFRAVCEDGDFKGKWRETRKEAINDAEIHQAEQKTHTIQIEFEQKGRMSFNA